MWVIAIDNVEQMDNESWQLIRVILDLDLILLVMTMRKKQKVSQIAEETLSHRRLRMLKLPSIDKWFHAGLACQTLGVFAIPAELEK